MSNKHPVVEMIKCRDCEPGVSVSMSGPEEASLVPGAPALYTELVRNQADTGGRKVSHEYVDPDTVRRMRNTGANIRNMGKIEDIGNIEDIISNNRNIGDRRKMEVTSNLRSIEDIGNIEDIMRNDRSIEDNRNIRDRNNMEVTSNNLRSMTMGESKRMVFMEEDNGNMEHDTGNREDSRVRLDSVESGKTEYFFMQGSDSPCNITYQSSRPRVQSIMDKIE